MNDVDSYVLYTRRIERVRGYFLHVNTWKDADDLVHVLDWSHEYGTYMVVCKDFGQGRMLPDDGRVPANKLRATCLWCVQRFA